MTEDPEFRRERMTDPSAQLLRPIIHQWVTADVVNFEAFKLSTADKKRLESAVHCSRRGDIG